MKDISVPDSLMWNGRTTSLAPTKKLDVLEQLRILGCDPIAGMARVAAEAEQGMTKIDKNGKTVVVKDYALAGQMYKELAQYIAPKKKAVEHFKEDMKDVSNRMTITIDPT